MTRSINVTFSNSFGSQLSGILDFPLLQVPRAYALFGHCFTCSKNLHAVEAISRGLINEGFAVLRFDFTGLGSSQGDFTETGFSTNLSDLCDAYQFLEANYAAPQLLIGHSLGGAAALHVAHQLDKVKAVVTIGAPMNPDHVTHLLKDGLNELISKGEALVEIGGRPFKLRKQFLDDLNREDTGQLIRNLDKALLILHSPQDKIVGINNAAQIYDQALHPKSFISLDGADHLLTNVQDAEYAGKITGSWAGRYLKSESHDEIAPEGEVWVRGGPTGYLTEITAGRHQVWADEPTNVGGQDLGPSPYGYLLSALGSCTAMTLRMYADRKKIDLKEVTVRLTHKKIHASDGQDRSDSPGKIDHIGRKISLKGNLTEKERKRLIEIADKCPVHRTIEGKPEIETIEV